MGLCAFDTGHFSVNVDGVVLVGEADSVDLLLVLLLNIKQLLGTTYDTSP